MNKSNNSSDRTPIGVALAFLILAGCVGYVEPGYSATVVAPAPDVYMFGGPYYERGPVVHEYWRRGAESRHWVHPHSVPRRRD
ncbi:MAG TPA: hypothetical protein VMF06_21120 [Candidatus Limnocylindria bacterium]|jgi:hypothetical protein|nr:hypothetical protein [Candidatus Limnocylindria bacterium]